MRKGGVGVKLMPLLYSRVKNLFLLCGYKSSIDRLKKTLQEIIIKVVNDNLLVKNNNQMKI